MPESLPIAEPQKPRRSRPTARLSALRFATLHFLRPRVLPVLALALMAAGWSYGLKLSHYFLHTDVTRASNTRMWLDHRNDATVAPVARQQVQDKFHTLELNLVSSRAVPRASWKQLVSVPAPAKTAEFTSPLHPLRAPPISLSLA